jgi:hypothetical protein
MHPVVVHLIQRSVRQLSARANSPVIADIYVPGDSLDNPDSVAWQLGALREPGAERQFRVLADRLPAVGWFDFFRNEPTINGGTDLAVSPTAAQPHRGPGRPGLTYTPVPKIAPVGAPDDPDPPSSCGTTVKCELRSQNTWVFW